MASGGPLGFGLLGGTGTSGTGILSNLTSGGGLVATLVSPAQKRLTAIQAAGTGGVMGKFNSALAASPLGARLSSLGSGGLLGGSGGTGTDRRPIRKFAEPYAPGGGANARNPNNGFLSHF